MKWFQVFYIQIFLSAVFLSEKLILSDRMKILSISSRKLSEFSTVINLLLHL